ncbi:hypothetical protein O181_000696 [Austropuccinia psidii MF-1]|uniref:Uncharacterized protein n=1 Tax=Austropuccinia psidii MF-1 TaxID=1389203 RepID=A0A9Q3B903_9BASI|nr:hypothetical protein [Austropuccinia psidii MF-1]
MSQEDTLQIPYGNHQKLESQQAVQNPGRTGSQDEEESINYPSHRRKFKRIWAYSDSFRLTRIKTFRLPIGFTPLKHQKISLQGSPIFTITGSFQEETSIKEN